MKYPSTVAEFASYMADHDQLERRVSKLELERIQWRCDMGELVDIQRRNKFLLRQLKRLILEYDGDASFPYSQTLEDIKLKLKGMDMVDLP